MRVRRLLFALVASLLFTSAGTAYGQVSEPTVVVSSAEQLQEALRSSARRISLRRGEYRFVRIENIRPDRPLTIAPTGPSEPVVIHRLSIAGSTNLVFEGIVFRPHVEDTGQWPLAELRGGSQLAFRRVTFVVDEALAGKRLNGMFVDGADGLVVADSRFDGLERAIDLQGVRNTKIEHNAFDRLGTSALTINASSDLTVASNRFRGFRGEGMAHFVHVSTRGASAPARNLTVRSNVMVQDTPKLAVGVLFSNEARLAYETIDISDNIVVVGSPRGITVDLARNVTIERNALLDAATSTFNNALRLSNVSDGSVAGNLAVAYSLRESPRLTMRMNVPAPKLQSRARAVFLNRLEEGLGGKGDGRLHAGYLLSREQRAAGPRL